LWYQLLQQETSNIPWNVLKFGLLARYGPTQFYDYFGELTKLQQSGTVKEYQTRFEQLLAKAGPLSSTRQVSCFVSPGHRCKKLFLIEACCEEEDGDMVMDIEAQEALESLEESGISLHAISGVQAPETMRLTGNLHSVLPLYL
jgi:hypothetical protein